MLQVMLVLLSSLAPVGSETVCASWKELAFKCGANACNFSETMPMSSTACCSSIFAFSHCLQTIL
jgi:hypothetical protein